ncbi:glycosyltransferase family 4 protein [Desulfohalobiaceae bacterium Ax17]|jgi:glycosyltransferase involved in cell wall biosynthesis|uniref:glycosyltransferase family 4 protein n=1 Tax=Desulfovulcanus ferrireducens TaxID=2831190 RepID=UPI00207BA4DA|nr:glycosyltransferase family 4 protein [Desulfovulcanus ferrireducens]MBT8763368.1 glycosyltransferase family 4 protein [Desulfovulcanus ferrireducens]
MMADANRKSIRMAVLTSHPIQYQAPLFRRLSQVPGLALRVFFCWDFGVREGRDPQFGRAFKWDIPLLEGYDYEFLKNVSSDPGTHWYYGLKNIDAVERILAYMPDVCWINGYCHWTERQVLKHLKRRGVQILFRGESNFLVSPPLWKRMIKWFYLRWWFANVDRFLCIGSLNREFYLHYGVSEEHLFLAPYAVDNDFFSGCSETAQIEARRWRVDLGIAPDTTVVLFAAKLIPKKRPLDLLRAFAGCRHVKHAVLVFVGDGELRDDLIKEVERLRLTDRVYLLGFQNQSRMPTCYALGDIMVLPSMIEPWGLAVNEAMNLARPIIVSTRVGAAPDLVAPGKAGWIFPAGDSEALTRCLDEALEDRRRLVYMGIEARERIKQWGIDQTVEGILNAVRSL